MAPEVISASQTPAFEQKGLFQNLLESEYNSNILNDRLRAINANPLGTPNFDAQGSPTYLTQDTHFFRTMGDRFNMGHASLEPLEGSRWFLESVGEHIAGSVDRVNSPGNFINDYSAYVVEGVSLDPSEVGIDQVYEDIPASTRAMLEDRGYDTDRLKELQINTAEKFGEFYPNLVDQIRSDQSLKAFNDAHPILAGVAGTATFVANFVDPILIATVVATGGSSIFLRTAAKTALKESLDTGIKVGIKKTVANTAAQRVGSIGGGPTGFLLEKIARKEITQSTFGAALMRALGAGAGSTYAITADIAAQQAAIELGFKDPELTNVYLSGAIGGAFGGILSHVALSRAAGTRITPDLSAVKIFNRSPESVDSLPSLHANRKEMRESQRLGYAANRPIDPEETAALETANSLISQLYDGETAERVAERFAQVTGEPRDIPPPILQFREIKSDSTKAEVKAIKAERKAAEIEIKRVDDVKKARELLKEKEANNTELIDLRRREKELDQEVDTFINGPVDPARANRAPDLEEEMLSLNKDIADLESIEIEGLGIRKDIARILERSKPLQKEISNLRRKKSNAFGEINEIDDIAAARKQVADLEENIRKFIFEEDPARANRANNLEEDLASLGKDRSDLKSLGNELKEAEALVTKLEREFKAKRKHEADIDSSKNRARIAVMSERIAALEARVELTPIAAPPASPAIFLDTLDVIGFGKFAQQFPTAREMLDALDNPKGFIPIDTVYARWTRQVEAFNNRRIEAQRTGDIEGEVKANKLLEKAVKGRHNHVVNNFSLDNVDMGTALQALMRQVPVEVMADPQQRAKAILDALLSLDSERTENYRTSSFVSKYFKAQAKFLFGALNSPKQHVKIDIASKDPTVSMIARLTAIVDSSGLDGAETLRNVEGLAIIDSYTRGHYDVAHLATPVAIEADRLAKLGFSKEDMFKNMWGHRLEGIPLDAEFKKLYDLVFVQAMDTLGKRGMLSGTLKNINKTFAPFTTKGVFDVAKVKPALTAAFRLHYGNIYGIVDEFGVVKPLQDLDAPVNYKALEKAGFLELNAKGEFVSRTSPLTGEKFFKKIPEKVRDLEADMLDLYEKRLPSSLDEDADVFFAKKNGSSNDDRSDDGLGAPIVPRTNSIDSKQSRVIDQRIYMDKGVLDSGYIDMDPFHSVLNYVRTTGYNIARDEATGELFGQRISFPELMNVLKQAASGNSSEKKQAQAALKRLRKMDARAGGRFQVGDDFAVTAAVINNSATAIISGPLALTVGTVEGSATVLRTVVSGASVIDQVRLLKNAAKNLNKEQLAHMGILQLGEVHSSRFLAGLNSETLSANVRNNPAVRGTKAVAQFARKAFGESLTTHLAKTLTHGTTFAKLHFKRKKLTKIREGIKFLADNPDNVEGAARAAGLTPADFSLLRDSGILTKDMMDAADVLLSIDKEALFSIQTMSAAIAELPSSIARKGPQELYERLSRMALRDADTFIATPRPGDLNLSDNAFQNMIFSMMSFTMSHYTNTLTRVSRAPAWKQMGFFSYLVLAEVNNSIIRDFATKGKSFEEIEEEWRDDPVGRMAGVLTRVPVTNAFSLIPLATYAAATRNPKELFEQGSASFSIVGNAVNNLYQISDSLVKGEELTDAQKRNAGRYLPLYNNFMLQLLEKTLPND